MSKFCFAMLHDNDHPYLCWTEDIEQSPPVWYNNASGIPDRGFQGPTHKDCWAPDPSAPRDRWYGRANDGPTGTSEAIYYNSELRNGGTWVNKFDVTDLRTLVGDANITEFQIGGLATTPTIPGSVWAVLHGTRVDSSVQLYVVHSHDYGITWTGAVVTHYAGATIQYASNLVINDHDPDAMYFCAGYYLNGGTHIYRSLDGGHTWSHITQVGSVYNSARPSFLIIPYDGNESGDILYTIEYGGLWKSTNATTACTFTIINNTIGGNDCPGGKIPPDNSDRILMWWSYSTAKQLGLSNNGGVNFDISSVAPDHVRVACTPLDGYYFVGSGYAAGPAAVNFILQYHAGLDTWSVKDGNLSSIFSSTTYVRCSYIYVKPGPAIYVHAVEGIPETDYETELPGDRSAFDITHHEDLHATDIAEDAMIRHLPAPGADGNIAQDNGTNWVSRTLAAAGISEVGHTHALDDLSDVDTSVVQDGDTLVYDDGTSTWLVGAAAGAASALWEPLTNGAGDNPELVYLDGDVIMVEMEI